MDNKLIVRPKTEVAAQAEKKDILAIYGVPETLDKVVEKEKRDLLNTIECGAVIVNELNRLDHSEDFIVEIPSGLREMLRKGEAAFDKSAKNPGAYTPNIRIEGETGISGQATIVEKADPQAATQSIANLAMMGMVQSVMSKLEAIEGKLDDIQKGQENDRIGKIISAFKHIMMLYPTFKSQEQLIDATNTALLSMQEGLADLHLQIDQKRKKLNGAPGNWRQVFWDALKSRLFFNEENKAKGYQQAYISYVYDIQLYNRLILLSDVVLYLRGDHDVISRNHKEMVEYCDIFLDDKFRKTISYLMKGKGEIEEITNILKYNENLALALEGFMANDLIIECKQSDIKYLSANENETREH